MVIAYNEENPELEGVRSFSEANPNLTDGWRKEFCVRWVEITKSLRECRAFKKQGIDERKCDIVKTSHSLTYFGDGGGKRYA